jgi:hypothetical protein
MDGANAVDGVGDVVAAVVAAVVEGVVGELEHAADRTTHRRIPRRAIGINRARARTLPAPAPEAVTWIQQLAVTAFRLSLCAVLAG